MCPPPVLSSSGVYASPQFPGGSTRCLDPMKGLRCGAVLRRRARNSERGRAPLGLANEANEEEPACETRSTHPRSPPSPCPRAKAAAEVICQGVFTILSCQDFRNPKSSIQGAPLIEARGTVVAAKY